MTTSPVRTRTRLPAEPQKVGYGNPPKHTQFKKGGQGGPGRPKGSTSFLGDLQKLMKEKLPATVNGRRIMITQREALLRRLFEQGLKGHLPSLALLFKLETLCQEPSGETSRPPADAALTPSERRLLSEHLARMRAAQGEDIP